VLFALADNRKESVRANYSAFSLVQQILLWTWNQSQRIQILLISEENANVRNLIITSTIVAWLGRSSG
jgi:hypothetical protein